MNNQLKLIDQLKETVLPFLLGVEFNGKIISVGKGLSNVLGKDIQNHHIEDFITFVSPNSFSDCISSTKSENQAIKIQLKEKTIALKGNAHIYKNESIVLFVFIPIFNDLNSLTNSGINLADIPDHSLISEYIFLVQNHNAEKEKNFSLLEDVKQKNNKLNQHIEELKKMARFPDENPNPVVRISDEGIVEFANESSEKQLLSVLGLRVGDTVPDSFNLLLNQAYSSKGGIYDKTIELNGKIYSITIIKVPKRNYFNLYAIEITNTKQEVHIEKKELKNLQNEIKQVKDGLERKISSQSNEIALNKITNEENLIHGSIVQEIFLKQNYHSEGFTVFYQPKNIVSADFFLIEKIPETTTIYISIGDCIGKELTGSFLSIYFSNQIRNTINTNPTDASLITLFNAVEKNTINNKFYSKVNRFTSTDFSLLRIDTSKNEIEFATNNHNFITFNEKNNVIYQPTNDSKFFSVTSKTTNREIKSGTFSATDQQIILFTDGIINQFGGNKHKKLKRKNLYQWIEKGKIFHNNTCLIEDVFNNYKLNEDQIDDCTWVSYKL